MQEGFSVSTIIKYKPEEPRKYSKGSGRACASLAGGHRTMVVSSPLLGPAARFRKVRERGESDAACDFILAWEDCMECPIGRERGWVVEYIARRLRVAAFAGDWDDFGAGRERS